MRTGEVGERINVWMNTTDRQTDGLAHTLINRQSRSQSLVRATERKTLFPSRRRVGRGSRARYTADKQSLTGGQEQFADGQGQSFGGQGLHFGWAGAVMLSNYKVGQFRVVQNFL